MLSPANRELLRQICPNIVFDVDMGKYSTFRVGGQADALIQIERYELFNQSISLLNELGLTWRVIGGGSNILVVSEQLHEVLFRLTGECAEIKCSQEELNDGRYCLSAGAGCSLSRLLSYCIEHELSGLEWTVGIPGTVGGAIRMNAGAHGSDIASCLQSVQLVDTEGALLELDAGDIEFSYRKAIFPMDKNRAFCIASGNFFLHKGLRDDMQRVCSVLSQKRKKAQPLNYASAGSFFKNPKGDAAGRLIDAAGLKGLKIGGAMVSPRHANFIVNTGDASPQDIVVLMEQVQQKVAEMFDVKLEPEVIIL